MSSLRGFWRRGKGKEGRLALLDHAELQGDHYCVDEVIGIELLLDGFNMHFDCSRRDVQEIGNGLDLMAFRPQFKNGSFPLGQPPLGVGTLECMGQRRQQVTEIFHVEAAFLFRIQNKRDVASQFVIPRLNGAATQRVLQLILPHLLHKVGINLPGESARHVAPDKWLSCPQPLREDRILSEHPLCEIPAKERFGVAYAQDIAELVSAGVAPRTDERPIRDEGMYLNEEPFKLFGSSTFPGEAVNGIE